MIEKIAVSEIISCKRGMMSNFNFMKNINKDLFSLISDAEKLFRDEYFEQCCTQTRRFAENVCKSMLQNFEISRSSFDDMLNFLKDNFQNTVREKEFIDDLYFLKRAGNSSVHSSKVKQDGDMALECLQRSFEIAVNYVFKTTANESVLKLRYDTELLATGKKSKKTLSEKYTELKEKETKTQNNKENKIVKKSITTKKQSHKKDTPKQENYSKPAIIIPFWKMLIAALAATLLLNLILFLVYKFLL